MEIESNGLTRRELFLMGNALALPTLLGRLDGAAEAAAAAGPLVAGTADLSVDWRGACHQLPRYLHHHRRVGASP